MKRTTVRILVALSAIICAVSVANAQDAEAALQGKGKLIARGIGTAAAHGAGVFGTAGAGSLVIKSSDATKIEVEGFTLVRQEGDMFFYQGQGYASVRGRDIALRLTGAVNRLRCVGVGTVLLKGHGKYRSGTETGTWSEEGTTVKLGDPAP
ncbi:MAG TPA: hypothetical protein VJH03_00760 [Blastocatellia bacterium]|nr:hypothetical protein [Blastocatellia bacterium]